jgi:GntR family transcriptional regulator of arabinose operon
VRISPFLSSYREALFSSGVHLEQDLVRRGDPDDPDFIRKLLKECRPAAIVCANDFIAARVMASLASRGVSVPREMRIVGIDDVKYASLLPVPLTNPTPELRGYWCHGHGNHAAAYREP